MWNNFIYYTTSEQFLENGFRVGGEVNDTNMEIDDRYLWEEPGWLKQDIVDCGECVDPDESVIAAFMEPAWLEAGDQKDEHPPAMNPIWDQNGNCVKFESYLSPEALAHIQLFDLNTPIGQHANMCRVSATRSVRWGTPVDTGAVQIKFAWREIVGGDCKEHEFIMKEGGPCKVGGLGLVAMHIVSKMDTAGESWVWATFSHVNNVDGDKPFFRDPDCKDCVDNRCPTGEPRKTQIARIHQIPNEVTATKATGIRLGWIDGVYKQYDLVGVERLQQYYESSPRYPAPSPGVLANEIIEWDRQESSCIGCHSRARIATFDDHEDTCERLCQGLKCPHFDRRRDGDYVCNATGNDCARVHRRVRCSTGTSCYGVSSRTQYLADFSWRYDFWNSTPHGHGAAQQ